MFFLIQEICVFLFKIVIFKLNFKQTNALREYHIFRNYSFILEFDCVRHMHERSIACEENSHFYLYQ